MPLTDTLDANDTALILRREVHRLRLQLERERREAQRLRQSVRLFGSLAGEAGMAERVARGR